MNIAIITGASAGLGREYALAAAQRYPEIDQFWLIARRVQRLDTLAERLGYSKVRLWELDLSHSASYDRLASAVKAEGHEVRLLINCAGLGAYGPISEVTYAEQANMIDVNVKAAVALTAALVPYMPKKAKILNVASIAGFAPTPYMTVYSCTKIFLLNFSRALRYEERKKRLKVLAVCPGPMKTEFLDIARVNSKKFDSMPVCDPVKIAATSLKLLDRGRAVYTPGAFLKLYRVLAKLIPTPLWLRIADLKK